jgi:hypothetical protein
MAAAGDVILMGWKCLRRRRMLAAAPGRDNSFSPVPALGDGDELVLKQPNP